ncbi:MAG: hypothetical protein WAO83_19220 [Fuerstiella sp.]
MRWKLNADEAAKSDVTWLEEFQYLDGVPKLSDLSEAMSANQSLGYHSMIEPNASVA